MNYLKNFDIVFSALPVGLHFYKYQIDDRFFSEFNYEGLSKGLLNVSLSFDKSNKLLVLDFNIDGYLTLTCDRCLEEFDNKINITAQYVYKLVKEKSIEFYDNENLSDDNCIYIKDTDTVINISNNIYESIILNLPISPKHPNDENGNPLCNKEMLAKLSEYLVENENNIDYWNNLNYINFN